jgi:hypothetical protein
MSWQGIIPVSKAGWPIRSGRRAGVRIAKTVQTILAGWSILLRSIFCHVVDCGRLDLIFCLRRVAIDSGSGGSDRDAGGPGGGSGTRTESEAEKPRLSRLGIFLPFVFMELRDILIMAVSRLRKDCHCGLRASRDQGRAEGGTKARRPERPGRFLVYWCFRPFGVDLSAHENSAR